MFKSNKKENYINCFGRPLSEALDERVIARGLAVGNSAMCT